MFPGMDVVDRISVVLLSGHLRGTWARGGDLVLPLGTLCTHWWPPNTFDFRLVGHVLLILHYQHPIALCLRRQLGAKVHNGLSMFPGLMVANLEPVTLPPSASSLAFLLILVPCSCCC